MASILMWIGIIVIVIGWLALSLLASKRMAMKEELEKFSEKKHQMMLRRNYSRLIILAGIALLLIALLI